jgi:VanZ family protein
MSAAQRSSAWPLALGTAAVIVYASLYPLEGWRWPDGVGLAELVQLPWMPPFSAFDEWSNFFGYAPTAMLLYLALVRSGSRAGLAALLALLGPAALSFSMELLQSFVPRRVPSLRDLAWNSAGAGLGVALGAIVHASGALNRWQQVRDRWLLPGNAWALALLAVWPLALLFPAPLPFGLGQVGQELRELASAAVAGTPLASWAAPWLAAPAALLQPLPAREALAMALGLLAPCLLAFSVSPAGWRRLLLAAGALALGFAATSLSAVLNFSPEHALAWRTDAVTAAFVLAAAVAAVAAFAPRRLAAVLGLVVLTALVLLAGEASADPYFEASLSGWEQGRFVRFHGLAQWLGWLWPYGVMAWFAALLLRREPRGY